MPREHRGGGELSLGSSGKATLWESHLFWVLKAEYTKANKGTRDILDTETASAKAQRHERAWWFVRSEAYRVLQEECAGGYVSGVEGA